MQNNTYDPSSSHSNSSIARTGAEVGEGSSRGAGAEVSAGSGDAAAGTAVVEQAQAGASAGGGDGAEMDEDKKPLLPWAFIDCETDDLVVLIAHMLNKLLEHNDQVVLTPSSLTRFHSRAPPGISVIEYLRRIVKYTNLEKIPLLSILAYIDTACTRLPSFTLSSLTVHRFLIAGITVGSKALCDVFCTNGHYAKVGGIRVGELNALEREFLKICDWDLAVPAELLQQYYSSLIRSHGGFRQREEPEESPFVRFPLGPAFRSNQMQRGTGGVGVKKKDGGEGSTTAVGKEEVEKNIAAGKQQADGDGDQEMADVEGKRDAAGEAEAEGEGSASSSTTSSSSSPAPTSSAISSGKTSGTTSKDKDTPAIAGAGVGNGMDVEESEVADSIVKSANIEAQKVGGAKGKEKVAVNGAAETEFDQDIEMKDTQNVPPTATTDTPSLISPTTSNLFPSSSRRSSQSHHTKSYPFPFMGAAQSLPSSQSTSRSGSRSSSVRAGHAAKKQRTGFSPTLSGSTSGGLGSSSSASGSASRRGSGHLGPSGSGGGASKGQVTRSISGMISSPASPTTNTQPVFGSAVGTGGEMSALQAIRRESFSASGSAPSPLHMNGSAVSPPEQDDPSSDRSRTTSQGSQRFKRFVGGLFRSKSVSSWSGDLDGGGAGGGGAGGHERSRTMSGNIDTVGQGKAKGKSTDPETSPTVTPRVRTRSERSESRGRNRLSSLSSEKNGLGAVREGHVFVQPQPYPSRSDSSSRGRTGRSPRVSPVIGHGAGAGGRMNGQGGISESPGAIAQDVRIPLEEQIGAG